MQMRQAARFIAPFFLSLAVSWLGPPAYANDATARALTAQLEREAATRPVAALADLSRLDAALVGASAPMQREVLLRLRQLHRDVGDYQAAAALNARLRSLGKHYHDRLALAQAALGDLDDQIRAYNFAAAKAAKESMERDFDLASMPEVNFAAQMSFGRLHLLNSEYERTLAHYEAARALASRQAQPDAARAEALMNLGQLYNASKDPVQALRHVDEAAPYANALRPRMRSHLHFTRAQVLVNLGRLSDAQAAFQRALEIARAGGIDVMETHVLGNMADLALRRHRWREAEQLARDALAVASRSHDESAQLMARANLGFALGGQGDIAAARPLVDGAIAKFREDGNLQALAGMLDEKASLLERVGLYKEGMAVLREQQALERKQFTIDRANAVAALQDRIAQAENHRRIQQLQEENLLKDADIRNRELKQLALALVALLLLAVGGFVFVLYRRAGESNSQLRELNTRLEYHAERDALTGLYNRRSFVEKMRADTKVPLERRGSDAPASDIYMILDIDHFKRVNDTHGHGAGDQVLVEVARRLQQAVRDGDTVLRWGGEEFVIHFRGKQGAQAAMLGARILAAIGSAPIQAGSVELDITASAGLIELPLAGVPPATLDWERAIALADMALYRAKAAGRNQCCHVIGLAGDADAGRLAELEPMQAMALLETTTIAGPLRVA